MLNKRKLIECFLLSLSAWAVLATSRKQDYSNTPVRGAGALYAVVSTCEDAVENEGALEVWSYNSGTLYQAAEATSFGMPSNSIHSIDDDISKGENAKILTSTSDLRSCEASVPVDFFDNAAPIVFHCRDAGSTEESCSVTLMIASLSDASNKP